MDLAFFDAPLSSYSQEPLEYLEEGFQRQFQSLTNYNQSMLIMLERSKDLFYALQQADQVHKEVLVDTK